MGTRSLEKFFSPKSIAVIGASEREGSLGRVILSNLIRSEFKGDIFPVNVKRYRHILNIPAYSRISQLPENIELAIICTPAETVPRSLIKLAARGVGAVVILTGGSARVRASTFSPNKDTIIDIAKKTGIRIIGPDSIGLQIPAINLNASYLPTDVSDGDIAYIGQSGALANAIADWGKARSIGFSHILTIGQSNNVTIADAIDYLAPLKQVKTILVQLDSIDNGPRLIRALRAASKHKLVIGMKSNRSIESPLNNDEVVPGLNDQDILVDEMFARSGVLRVSGVKELFDCVDILHQRHSVKGGRLAIISNSQGGAILAVDRLLHDNGELAKLTIETKNELKHLLPEYGMAKNPVILNPELTPELLTSVGNIVLKDKGVDAVLVVYTPGVGADPIANAQALVDLSTQTAKSIISCWMGEHSVAVARDLFDAEFIPTYDTPDHAIKSFMYMVRHKKTQELLKETPQGVEIKKPNIGAKLYAAIDKKGNMYPKDAWQLLESYGIQMADSKFKFKIDNLVLVSSQISKPWVLKLHHKQYLAPFAYGESASNRWKGAAIGINNPDEITTQAGRLIKECKENFPDSGLVGFSLQTQQSTREKFQFSFGIGTDKFLGGFVFFGAGGSVTNILLDRKVAMVPLNTVLARKLIETTQLSNVLRERSVDYERDIQSITGCLLAVSQLKIDFPQVKSLEANAVLDLDGRYTVLGVAATNAEPSNMAIQPYPAGLDEVVVSPKGNKYLLRPIKAEDEYKLDLFYQGLSAESLRFRFFNSRKRFKHNELARFSQIDYSREMAFIAESSRGDLSGIARVWIDADDLLSEFSVIVSDQLKGEQLGFTLMTKLIHYLKYERKVLQVHGSVMADNKPMLKLSERLGFISKPASEAGVMDIVLDLNKSKHEWQKRRLFKFHNQ